MPILDQKQYFLCLGVHFKAPHPILQMPDSKKHVLQGMGAGKWVIQPPPLKWPFFAQEKPKNANFGPKTVFFGHWVAISRAPLPISHVLDSKKHVLQG